MKYFAFRKFDRKFLNRKDFNNTNLYLNAFTVVVI